MSGSQTILGPILNPRDDGQVDFIRDGAIACDDSGVISFVGRATDLNDVKAARRARGVIVPPFLDAHIHIPQNPIRGRFVDGVPAGAAQGRLIAGLNRNVFPAEARCASESYTREVVARFLQDTMANGVVGGAAYMTVHPQAARIALEMLPAAWSVGLVLMDMNCPEYLRTQSETLERDVRGLARDFGRRLIVTDRFAVAVSSALRRRGVALARELGLRMQTHLNEQIGEKRLIESELYPDSASYTEVYLRDGLLDCEPILAHCVRMRPEEFDLLTTRRCAIAHCPTSNTLLGSGVMPLDEVLSRNIPYAICTDVGASPTVSLLAEMAQFLKVHAGQSERATPSEALARCTLGPAKILALEKEMGSFAPGRAMSFVEVECDAQGASADEVILQMLGMSQKDLDEYRDGVHGRTVERLKQSGLDAGPELDLLEADMRDTARRLEDRILSVTLAGREVFRREPGTGGMPVTR